MELEGLTRTALFVRHVELGAKFAPFAGWAMPLEYRGTLAEHAAVRERVGVFDVSHLGTLWVTGPGAEATLAATFTNDVSMLGDGQSQYTLCCNQDGGIVDDLIVYRLASDRFLVVPNAGNTAEVAAALDEAAVELLAGVENASLDVAMMAVQGPRALEVLAAVTGAGAAEVAWMSVLEVKLARNTAFLCRTGYTGEVGGEIVLPNAGAQEVFDALVDHGAVPCGLGARDTLRLEMGYPLHGNDLTTGTSPYEARLGWAVELDREPFRGQEALRRLRDEGPRRRLWGLAALDRGIPRRDMTVLRDGRPVGEVTSGGFSPTLRKGIALAYLDVPLGAGERVDVDVRGRTVPFAVVRPPFVTRDPRADGTA